MGCGVSEAQQPDGRTDVVSSSGDRRDDYRLWGKVDPHPHSRFRMGLIHHDQAWQHWECFEVTGSLLLIALETFQTDTQRDWLANSFCEHKAQMFSWSPRVSCPLTADESPISEWSRLGLLLATV